MIYFDLRKQNLKKTTNIFNFLTFLWRKKQEEGHTVIQLTTDVLTKYYKPYGSLFDACSNGQLLLLSQREGECGYSRRITREECNTLNTLAEEIARG